MPPLKGNLRYSFRPYFFFNEDFRFWRESDLLMRGRGGGRSRAVLGVDGYRFEKTVHSFCLAVFFGNEASPLLPV